jgi:hypothetical protein
MALPEHARVARIDAAFKAGDLAALRETPRELARRMGLVEIERLLAAADDGR